MAKIDAAETPMMRQFREIKNQYPDAVLLFRCGDFYETYAEDAVRASKILNITLTHRSNGASKEAKALEMAGFPFHALETYQKRNCFASMALYLRSGKRLHALKTEGYTPPADPPFTHEVTTILPAWLVRTGPVSAAPTTKPRIPVPVMPPKKPQPVRVVETISITPRPGKNTGPATDFLIQEDES